MLKSYKYRLIPTEEQKKHFASVFGCVRFIYNLALEVKMRAWKTNETNISSYQLMKQLTELKHTECEWLKDCYSSSLESAIANLDKAYQSFFRGNGFPKFKKKNNRQSIHYRRAGRIEGNMILIPKAGWVEFIKHRELWDGEIREVVVSVNPSGEYYVSILLKDDKSFPDKKPMLEETAVGVDLGLKSFATLSDGQFFDNPKHLQVQLNRLRVELRTLNRRYKRGIKIDQQSKGWHKQRLVVSKLHQKIANQRNDFLHKVSTAIIKRYDTVCIEYLNIAGMIQNKNLAQSISCVGWGEFVRMLKYKADWCWKNISVIGRFVPSSKTCSDCGSINSDLTLSDRDWVCGICGSYHDRDINAAKNIKKIGLEAKPSIANVTQKSERIGCKKVPLHIAAGPK